MLEQSKINQGKIKDMFNSISHRYDVLNRVLSFYRDVSWRKKCIRDLKIKDGSIILDIACGTGDMLAIMQKVTNDCTIIGADFSIKMLHIAQDRIQIPLIAADACALPFKSGSFDYATSAFGFRNFVDKERALREIRRVLKPSGKLCLLEFSKPKSFIFKQLYWFYFKLILPLIGKLFSKHNDAYKYLPESVANFPDEPIYIDMIKSAGFATPQMISYDLGICTAMIARAE